MSRPGLTLGPHPWRVSATQRLAANARRPVVMLGIATLAVVLIGGWLWLRDSSLVAVRHVSVSGQTGPDASKIRRALSVSARTMTTLDVNLDELKRAVSPYPVVKNLRVSTQFPHGMRIQVIEQLAVGVIDLGGRTIAVAGDGTLLHDLVPAPALPTISLHHSPGGSRLTDPTGLSIVALLAAAPYQLLAHVGQVTSTSAHGLVVQLRNGPSVYFGDPSRLHAKWIAVSEVLGNSGSLGAVYLDVSDPGRPAAGGTPPPASASSATASTAQTPLPSGSGVALAPAAGPAGSVTQGSGGG